MQCYFDRIAVFNGHREPEAHRDPPVLPGRRTQMRSAIILILLFLACSATVSAAVTGELWGLANGTAGFPQRYQAGSVTFGNRMWVIGGFSNNYLNDTWSSADGRIWTLANASPAFSRRSAPAALVYNNRMWVIGGYDGTNYLNDTWSSADGKIWTLANASAAFGGREKMAAVTWQGKMWVIGGYEGLHYLNDVWYSTDGIQWTCANASAEFPQKNSPSAVVFQNRIWLVGGTIGGSRNDTYVTSDGTVWNRVNASAAFPGRVGQAALAFDNRLWIIGGYSSDSGYLNDTWYSGDGNLWYPANRSAGFSGRVYPASAVLNNRMWVIGGFTTTGYSNDVWYSVPVIHIRTPAGGQNWKRGTARTIAWNFTGTTGPAVRIELLRGGSVNRVINASTPIGTGGSGAWSWAVPFNQTPASDYRIRVRSPANPVYNDTSAIFTIGAGAPITVTNPDGGQNWTRNSTRIIRWSYTGNPGTKVQVHLLRGATVVRVINASTPIGSAGSGSCSWLIPASQAPRTDYRIRVRSTANSSFTDTSNANFTISS